MKTCVIACETIREELERALEGTAVQYPVFWLESGLHNIPEKLNKTLQAEIDKVQEYDRILLAMGFCGNSIQGIKPGRARLIIPRVDDCISLLLGSVERRRELVKGCGTYFLTKGWLAGEKNLWAEYQYAVEKYGKKRADRIMGAMLRHYERLGILDSGAYSLEEILPLTKRIAQELKLRHEVIPASGEYLTRLLTGPWEKEQFLLVEPGDVIKPQDLMDYY